jgi:hypothetical protein
MARSTSSVRIGEAERAAAQRALHDHLNAGRLQVTEYADRSAAAANAMTASEISALFADLPAPHPKLPGSPLAGIRRVLTIVGAVVVLALVGLLAFTIGRGGQNDPVPSSGPVAAPTPMVPPATEAVVAPTVSIAPSVDTTSESIDGNAAAPPGVTVRRTTGPGAITLRPSYGVDLDDDTSPNWSVGRGCCGRDVGWDGSGSVLYISNDYAVMPATADYTACSHETAYTTGPVERGSLQPDENICVRTSDNRYALVTIVAVSDQAVQFRATVWDPPFSS